MSNVFLETRRGKSIQRMVLVIDELSILAAFFTAYIVRFNAIRNWVDYSAGIYLSMVITAILFQIIVYYFYDYRRANVVRMDPIENLFAVIKSRLILTILFILYLFLTQKSVLASRIVVTLFLMFSVIYGYCFRMIYRRLHIRKWGYPQNTRAYQVVLPVSKDFDVMAKEIADGKYDCVLMIVNDTSSAEAREALSELEKRGIRTFLTIQSTDYLVRPGIVTDVGRYAAIPSFIRPERFELFGLKYCIARTEEAVHHVISHLEDLKGEYVCFSNVHTTVMARENPEYRDILNRAALLLPDGAPIAKLQTMKGIPGAERVAGPDFMENMFRDTADGKISHYFYGSTQETLDNLRKNLNARYPGINIKGMYSPPFREVTKEEDDEDVRRINESGADIVWIGLGAPKQEKWMSAHKGRINGVMMGVGAGFDFHAGTIERAPVWLQKVGLEWLYRLVKDPVRLYKRYIVTNVKFVWYLIWK